VGYSKLVRQKQLPKRYSFLLLAVSDYKRRLDTSLYFITTNLHTELNTIGKGQP